jgi:signal recognition particle receptor subunit beta
MVIYNAASRELTAKIVYYGPGLGGKTTNLQFLHQRLEPSSVGNLLTLAATADRTIYFDLLPVELGDIKGYKIRFQVATVPGQTPYNETRRTVLRGVDGIVFVVDSRWSTLPKNLESLQNLRDNLKEEGMTWQSVPIVIQFNKRDLPDVLAVDALQEGLGLGALPYIEGVATQGKGVVETFKLISKLTFVDILRRLQKKEVRPAAGKGDVAGLDSWKNAMVSKEPVAAPEAVFEEPPPLPEPPLAAAEEEAPFEPPPFEPEPPQPVSFETPFPEASSIEDTKPAFVPPAAAEPEPAFEPAEDTQPARVSEAVEAEPEPEPAPVIEEAAPPPLPPPPPPPAAPPRESRPSRLSLANLAPPPVAKATPRLDEAEAASARLASRVDELAAGLQPIAEKLAALETSVEETKRIAGDAGKTSSKELTSVSRKVDDAVKDWANARRTFEAALAPLKAAVEKFEEELAEASSREMEIVAQTSRESLGLQAAIEKTQFRINEAEGRLGELAVAHESRLTRTEKLLEDHANRSGQDRENLRRLSTDLDERLRAANDAFRDSLASTLSELAERVRRAVEVAAKT